MGKQSYTSKSFLPKSFSMKGHATKSFGGGFVWSDLNAEAWYDAMAVANGGDLNAALYSMDLDTLKGGLDTHVINLKSISAWTLITHRFAFVGGNQDTHAICMKDASSELTYNGSPSHGVNGMTIDSAFSQYASMNNDPSTEESVNDTHLMFLMNCNDNGPRAIGSITNVSSRMWMWFNSDTSVGCDMYSSTTGRLTGTITNNNNLPLIGTRTAANSFNIVVDGTSEANSSTSGGALTNRSTLIGACDNNGSIIYLADGDIKDASTGSGMSLAIASDYNDEIKDLHAFLGRL